MKRPLRSFEYLIRRHEARQRGDETLPRRLVSLDQLWERYRARNFYRATRSRRLWLKKLRRCGITGDRP